MNKVIISVLGKDQPGIIAAVSGALFEADCNIENVSQTILQSEFSGIFIVSIPEQMTLIDFQAALQTRLEPLNQHIHVKPLSTPQVAATEPSGVEPLVITTRGPDRKGLVARITEVIASHGVNVTNLQAVFKGGEVPTDNIMIYEVDVPSGVDQHRLRRSRRSRAAELGLEISIQHRQIFEALNRI